MPHIARIDQSASARGADATATLATVSASDTANRGAHKLSFGDLNSIIACPSCRASLALPTAGAAVCQDCGAVFPRLASTWDLTPPTSRRRSEAWHTWEQVQANGVVAYEAEPERNLGVGDREDYDRFRRFASLGGLVLDVGCGPQSLPTHFSPPPRGTRFVGIDPLVGDREADYTQVRGLAEYLPFRDGIFERVLFVTTLDHFVDVSRALEEARRVLIRGGRIVVWLGHKRADTPKPATSPAWYQALEQPQGADDLFHIERMDAADALGRFDEARLRVVAEDSIRVDAYRTNHFFSLEADDER